MITCRTTQCFSKSSIDDIYTTFAVQIVLCSSKKNINHFQHILWINKWKLIYWLTFKTHKLQLTSFSNDSQKVSVNFALSASVYHMATLPQGSHPESRAGEWYLSKKSFVSQNFDPICNLWSNFDVSYQRSPCCFLHILNKGLSNCVRFYHLPPL